jgi:hypothetical protein
VGGFVARTSRANELFEELELELEPEELEPEELEPEEERLFFVLRRLLLEELFDFLGLFAFLDLRTAPSVAIALLVAAIAKDIAASTSSFLRSALFPATTASCTATSTVLTAAFAFLTAGAAEPGAAEPAPATASSNAFIISPIIDHSGRFFSP